MMNNFSKRLIIVVFIITVLLIIINIVFYWFTGNYMESLFANWMQYVFGGEMLILGVIRISKEASSAVTNNSRIKKELDELKKMAENEPGKEVSKE